MPIMCTFAHSSRLHIQALCMYAYTQARKKVTSFFDFIGEPERKEAPSGASCGEPSTIKSLGTVQGISTADMRAPRLRNRLGAARGSRASPPAHMFSVRAAMSVMERGQKERRESERESEKKTVKLVAWGAGGG